MKMEELYSITDEPLRLNRFICDINLNGTQVDYRVVRGFFEDYISKYLYIEIAQYKGNDYEWLFTKAYGEDMNEAPKCECSVTMTSLSPDCHKVKHVEYKVSRVTNILYPKYGYDNDGIVVYTVVLNYDKRDITYFRGESKDSTYNCDTKQANCKDVDEKTEPTQNEKAFLKASVELLEDAKKRVKDKYSQYKNTEETMENVLKQIDDAENENKAYADMVGCTEEDMKNAKYKEPNGFEVEKYKKRRCKKNPSFMFGDFNTAFEWYKQNLIPKWKKGYVNLGKYDEIDNDIINYKRPTIVVASRQCGMTTHMIAWCLAYISSSLESEIWYVTNSKDVIFDIVKKIKSNIGDMPTLEYSNGWAIITNTQTNSKIRFVSINQNMENFFCGKNIPEYIVYDNMALYNNEKLFKFITILDEKQTYNQKKTKEICVSTPSKGGSLFNFLALTAPNVIKIPWYEGIQKISDKYDNSWAQQMKSAIGEENFNIECNCQIGSDEKECLENKPCGHSYFENACDMIDEWWYIVDKGCDNEKECCKYKNGFPKDYEKLNNYGHKPFRKDRLPDDYGYCFNDGCNGNCGCGNCGCDKEYEIEI